ncbi:MAG: hypothetical protein CMJ83_07740 [Planctomycetes bacterium]|jgi:hypothetical protein|nr:hypothetical protein [Planctomycetota bacterium]
MVLSKAYVVALIVVATVVALVIFVPRHGGAPDTFRLNAPLTPIKTAVQGAPGTLRIRSLPVSAAVYLDSELAGFARTDAVLELVASPGLHEVILRRPGWHDHVSTLRFVSGETREAIAHLVLHRRHHPQSQRNRTLRVMGTVRGSLEEGDRSSAAAYGTFGFASKPVDPAGNADVIDLVDLPPRPLTLVVVSIARKVSVRIYRDDGQLAAATDTEVYQHRLTFTPKKGRTYRAVVEHLQMDKFARMGLVRYTALLEPR